MSSGGAGNRDAFSEVAHWGIHLIAGFCLPSVICILITLLFVHREYLVDTALEQREVLRFESFPANLTQGWMWYAPSAGVITERSAPPSEPTTNSSPDTSLLQRGLLAAIKISEKIQPARIKIQAYWSLAVPRVFVVLGLLPGIIMIAIMAWWYGSFLNARWANAGQPFSSNVHKWCKIGLALSWGSLVIYVVLPILIPSTCILLPIAAIAATMAAMRRNRA